MELQDIIEAGRARETFTSVITFKLAESVKQEFVDYCLRNDLSMGRLFRAVVTEVLENDKESGHVKAVGE